MKITILTLVLLINITFSFGQKNHALKSKTKQSTSKTKQHDVQNKHIENTSSVNDISNNSASESNISQVFCTSESGYDYVNYYKLTLYDNGSAMMDKNGSKIIGKWGLHDGNIYAKFNNSYIFLEKEIDGNMIFDKQNRQWYNCFQ